MFASGHESANDVGAYVAINLRCQSACIGGAKVWPSDGTHAYNGDILDGVGITTEKLGSGL